MVQDKIKKSKVGRMAWVKRLRVCLVSVALIGGSYVQQVMQWRSISTDREIIVLLQQVTFCAAVLSLLSQVELREEQQAGNGRS